LNVEEPIVSNVIKPSDLPEAGSLRRFTTWIVIAVIYAAFFFWYTPFGGPLTEDEIARYESVLHNLSRNDEAVARWRDFMRGDTGDDFAMFNAMDYRETAVSVEGLDPGASGREALTRYAYPFFRRAVRDAAHPVAMGTAAAAALDVWGLQEAERWDQGALVRYRSRRDMMNQVVALAELAKSGENIHRFKIAGLEKTIAYPLDPWFHLGDPRLLLALVLGLIGLGFEVRRLSPAGGARPSDRC
jgi:hypothetical protein